MIIILSTEGNSIAMLQQTSCRNCLSKPEDFSQCPDVIGDAPPRCHEDMFAKAMSENFDNSEDKIHRLKEFDFFKSPIHQHPYLDNVSGIHFNPYLMPRCIEHDFSEGVIEYLVQHIFAVQCGSNRSERYKKTELLYQQLHWFPGVSGANVLKLTTVR